MGDKPPIRVLVTGAAGQIAYSLIHSIGKGDAFGLDQPIILHLLDIPPMMGVLDGVVMEIKDCAFSIVTEIVPTCQEEEGFKDVEVAFLVGAMPRKEGMERKDLLTANVKIFKSQGRALNKHANKNCKILVVGNPANTNALICSFHAKDIPKENFSAMTRLDQNRAQAQIAEQLHVAVSQVHDVVIWGNHSNTQYPDATKAKFFRGEEQFMVVNSITDPFFLSHDFVANVQGRGAKVIAARKLSSAMSAAKAAVDHMRDWWLGTNGRTVSMAVISTGNPYNTIITDDLFFSFPVTVGPDRTWTIKDDYDLEDTNAKEKILKTLNELEEESKEAMAVCKGED